MMDSNQDDDLFTVEDFMNLSSNLKSTSTNNYNNRCSLPSPSVKSGYKRSISSPSCFIPSKRTAPSPQTMVSCSSASNPQEHQRQTKEQDLSRKKDKPRAFLAEERSGLNPSNVDNINKPVIVSNQKLPFVEPSDHPTPNNADSVKKTVQSFVQRPAQLRTSNSKSKKQETPTEINITSSDKNFENENGLIQNENRVGIQEDLFEQNSSEVKNKMTVIEDVKVLAKQDLFERKSNSDKSFEQKKEMVESNSKFLKPRRMFKNSHRYNTAIRLNTNNISAEVLEAVLFDCLEGELILAEYQDNSFLKPMAQHKLVEILISRTSKHLIASRKLSDYCSKLADAIVLLFPNEDRNMYYIPPNVESRDAKGKLANKWRNLETSLRECDALLKASAKLMNTKNVDNVQKSSVLAKISLKPMNMKDVGNLEKTKDLEKKKNLYLTDDVKADLEWLRQYSEPNEAMKRWKATYKYRCETRKVLRSVSEFVEEWPILKSNNLFPFINYDFQMTFKFCNPPPTLQWEKFFNELYKQRSSAIAQPEGLKILRLYQKSLSKALNKMQMEGLQMLLLPYLVPAPSFKKAAAGWVRATINDSANGFVIWSKTFQSIKELLTKREKRYRKLGEKFQPCIVLEGESPDCINGCYLFIGNGLFNLKTSSPVFALHWLFKFYMAFNLKLPVDCTSVWLVITKVLYNITLKDYKVSPTIESLCGELVKNLK